MSTSDINVLSQNKYGITEKKKSELDMLSIKVLNAQNDVEQFEAIVNSLTEKSQKIKESLALTDKNRAQALSNRDLIDTVVQNALDLKNNSDITFNEVVASDTKIKQVAKDIKEVIDKLIYTAEVINKLSNLVIRKKALNPLISDELVTMITTAGKGANNAVAVTLVALNSVFTSQATTLESEAALTLECMQSSKLYEVLTGTEKNDKSKSLKYLLYEAYKNSEIAYKNTQNASTDTAKQLNNATADLEKAKIRLSSLRSGLAAANAAALAS